DRARLPVDRRRGRPSRPARRGRARARGPRPPPRHAGLVRAPVPAAARTRLRRRTCARRPAYDLLGEAADASRRRPGQLRGMARIDLRYLLLGLAAGALVVLSAERRRPA